MNSRWLASVFVVGLFVAGALVLWVGTRFGRLDARAAWGRFALEVGLVAWIAVPPALGEVAVRSTVAPLVWVLVWELTGLSRWGRVARSIVASVIAVASVSNVPADLVCVLAVASPLTLVIELNARRRNLIALAFVAPLAFGTALTLLGRSNDPVGAVDSAYAVVETSDSCAYLLGAAFGRALFWPRVSPKKTRAGVAAAVVTGALVGALAANVLFSASGVVGAGLGALGACAATAADFATSALKRRLGRKDFAEWMPHHGSAFDAYDSLIFVLPVWMLAWTKLR